MTVSPIEDPILYDKKDVRITRNLIQISGTQYHIRYIDTIKRTKQKADRSAPINCILTGVFILFFCLLLRLPLDFILVGVLVIIWGLIWLDSLKDKHTLILTTTVGKEVSYSSDDLDHIKKIQSVLESEIGKLAGY